MDYTPNYHLPQWEMTDRIRMEDFNTMNQKLDGSLNEHSTIIAQKAEQSALNTETINRTSADTTETQARQTADAALSARIDKCGNCRIQTYSYTGTGTYGESHPCVVSCPARPLFLVVSRQGDNWIMVSGYGVGVSVIHRGVQSLLVTTRWTENSVSWYSHENANGQMNLEGVTYHVMVLMAADE